MYKSLTKGHLLRGNRKAILSATACVGMRRARQKSIWGH